MEEKIHIEKDLEFFSSITASVTHEVTNVLAILNELIGLQGDYLLQAKQGSEIPIEKIERLQEKVINQIQRGKIIIKHLNYFSHTADCDFTEFDLIELVKNLVSLCERFASLRNVIIIDKYDIESYMLNADSFAIQKFLFNCLNIMIFYSEENATINVNIRNDDKLQIHIINNRVKFTESLLSNIKTEYEDFAKKIDLLFDIRFEDKSLKILINQLD